MKLFADLALIDALIWGLIIGLVTKSLLWGLGFAVIAGVGTFLFCALFTSSARHAPGDE